MSDLTVVTVNPDVSLLCPATLNSLPTGDGAALSILSDIAGLLGVVAPDGPAPDWSTYRPLDLVEIRPDSTFVLADREGLVRTDRDILAAIVSRSARILAWSGGNGASALVIKSGATAGAAAGEGAGTPEAAEPDQSETRDLPEFIAELGWQARRVMAERPAAWSHDELAAWFARAPAACGPQTTAPAGVVLYTKTLSPGGAERQWAYLAISLHRDGHRPTLVIETLEGSAGHYFPLLQEAGVPVIVTLDADPAAAIAVPSPSAAIGILSAGLMPDVDQVLRLTAIISRLRPRAVLAQLDEPNLVGGVAALLAGVDKVVLSFRNYNPTTFSYLDSGWFRPAYLYLVASPAVRLSGNHVGANDDYAEWMGIKPDKIAFVPNALDETIFPLATEKEIAAVRAEFGLAQHDRVLLGVFRLSEEKDPRTYFEVCRRVVKDVPDLTVLIAGVGPFEAHLHQWADEAGLLDRVKLVGRRDDVAALLAVSRLLLLTSRQEGMPNVLMEAQLAGVPVVATDVGGVSFTLVPGVTGFVRSAGDVEGLAEDCIRLLLNPYLATIVGKAGSVHARTAFSLEEQRRRYLDLLA